MESIQTYNSGAGKGLVAYNSGSRLIFLLARKGK
jgi:hypothetical protein